jgi:hypothetical protein
MAPRRFIHTHTCTWIKTEVFHDMAPRRFIHTHTWIKTEVFHDMAPRRFIHTHTWIKTAVFHDMEPRRFIDGYCTWRHVDWYKLLMFRRSLPPPSSGSTQSKDLVLHWLDPDMRRASSFETSARGSQPRRLESSSPLWGPQISHNSSLSVSEGRTCSKAVKSAHVYLWTAVANRRAQTLNNV